MLWWTAPPYSHYAIISRLFLLRILLIWIFAFFYSFWLTVNYEEVFTTFLRIQKADLYFFLKKMEPIWIYLKSIFLRRLHFLSLFFSMRWFSSGFALWKIYSKPYCELISEIFITWRFVLQSNIWRSSFIINASISNNRNLRWFFWAMNRCWT